jgi:glucose-1-phosphate adenylyltransferase
MNYADMFATHHKSGADVTIAGIPVSREAARSLGLMRLDDSGRVVGFVEKPQTPEETEPVRMDPAWFEQHGIASRGRDCIANMGIYLFNRETLADILSTTKFQDFGKEIFPKLVGRYRIQTHLFDGYWEDIGTIRAFYEANLSLAQRNPPFELVLSEAPIYTRPRFLPPTRLNNASVTNCLVADGCQIGEAVVIENSIIGLRCMIGDNVTIRNSVLMGADEFETATAQGRPPMGIGSGSVIEGAIVDKNARIGRNVRINNQRGIEDSEDANDCMIRDGIPIVIKDSTLSDGWTLSEQSMTDR